MRGCRAKLGRGWVVADLPGGGGGGMDKGVPLRMRPEVNNAKKTLSLLVVREVGKGMQCKWLLLLLFAHRWLPLFASANGCGDYSITTGLEIT